MKKTSPTHDWYNKIKKPSWAPPARVFGPTWAVLYILIAISFGKVFYMMWGGEINFWIVIPFVLNILFNIVFSPIQFTLKNNVLATIDIVLIRSTVVRSMVVIYPYLPWIVYMQIPYLLRVSFATVLQIAITIMNKNKNYG